VSRFEVSLLRTGGVTGARLSARADVDLSEREEQAWLARSADAGREPEGPDRFSYEVELARGDERHRVVLGETEVTDELRPLIDRLLEAARSG
jgi:hypothetical protein